MWIRTLFLSWSDNIHQHPNDRSNGNGLSLPLTSSPPHIGSLLSVRVEYFVPSSVCEVEAVGPQQEHEDDDDDVFRGQHWLVDPQLEVYVIIQWFLIMSNAHLVDVQERNLQLCNGVVHRCVVRFFIWRTEHPECRWSMICFYPHFLFD